MVENCLVVEVLSYVLKDTHTMHIPYNDGYEWGYLTNIACGVFFTMTYFHELAASR